MGGAPSFSTVLMTTSVQKGLALAVPAAQCKDVVKMDCLPVVCFDKLIWCFLICTLQALHPSTNLVSNYTNIEKLMVTFHTVSTKNTLVSARCFTMGGGPQIGRWVKVLSCHHVNTCC